MQNSGQGREVSAHSPLIVFSVSWFLLICTGPFAVCRVTDSMSLLIPTSPSAIAVPAASVRQSAKASFFIVLSSRSSLVPDNSLSGQKALSHHDPSLAPWCVPCTLGLMSGHGWLADRCRETLSRPTPARHQANHQR